MTSTAEPATLDAIGRDVERAAGRHRMWFFGGLAVTLAYFAFSWVQFDVSKVADRLRPDRAALFILDAYAHKDHVTMRWKTPDKVKVAFEGGHREVYDPKPAWFVEAEDGGREIHFQNGGKAVFYTDRVTFDWPGQTETFTMRRADDKTPYVEGYPRRPWTDREAVNDALAQGTWFNGLPEDLRPDTVGPISGQEWGVLKRGIEELGLDQPEGLPEWLRVTENKIEIRPTLYERLQVGTLKAEVHRYEIGWKYFWFDFDSPLVGNGFFDAIGLIVSGDRIVANQSNTSLIIDEFLGNAIWQHDRVLYAMLETIFMALIGTMIASAVGLPLAFMAARNVQPVLAIRFFLRRLFDLLRGIDTLIWSLIFLRAFGPGMFTGIFAIAFTDTGTLGKLMSEAIENADNKQREGIQSTGATKVQQHRFGILPQILPVFISQSLYYLESNTRSSVIIGAMGAGGIGLLFIKSINTGVHAEDIAYYTLLMLVTVYLIDALSARLRMALIGRDRASN